MKIIALLILGSFVSGLDAQDDCPLSRKVYKELDRVFDQSVTTDPFQITEDAKGLDDYLYDYDCLFELSSAGERIGFLIKTKALGRFEYFDYIVVFSPEKQVLGVSVIQYRSDHGAGICQRNWLKQFKGYNGERLEIGKDIDGVSGGTISAASLASDIQRCHQLLSLITAY